MSDIPDPLYYTATHEWARLEEDGSLVIGITDHAQELLGDMVYVELPEPGTFLRQEAECGVVESVKAASDIYSPVSGTVQEVNLTLNDEPQLVNEDPYGHGWIFRLQPDDPAEVEYLLTADDYRQMLEADS